MKCFWIITVRKQEYQPKNEQVYEEQIKKMLSKTFTALRSSL